MLVTFDVLEFYYSDNGSTFQATSKALPDLLKSPELKNALRKKGIRWEVIPCYVPRRGGSLEAMIKQFKRILLRISKTAAHKPSLIKLITYYSSAARAVNERPITSWNEDPKDYTVVTSTSLLSPGFDPYTPVRIAHKLDHLRRDYQFSVALAERFWKD